MSVERDSSSGVSEINEVQFEVSESKKVELEGGDDLNLSFCEDQEKVGEDSGENSEGEVKEGSEGSFVMVSDGTVDKSCGSVEEEDVFEEKSELENEEEKKEEVRESSDACNVGSVSSTKCDELVEETVEGNAGNTEDVPTFDDDEKNVEETNVETDLEVEVVKTDEEKQLEVVHAEEQEADVVEPKDSYEVKSDSSTKDVDVLKEGSLVDDDEKIVDTKLVADLEMERVGEDVKLVSDPVQPELHLLDNLGSTQQSCVGASESGDENLEEGVEDNQNSQTAGAEGAEIYKLDQAHSVAKIEDSSVMDSEYFNLAKSGDDVSAEKASRSLIKEENQELVENVSQEAVEIHEPEGVISENLNEAKSEKMVFVGETSQPLTKEENQEHVRDVDNTGSEVKVTDCLYPSGDTNGASLECSELTDEEKKEDGDSSYVFVDGVDVISNDPVVKEQVTDSATNSSLEAEKEENQAHPHAVVVGTVLCGPHHISSVEAKLETETVNNSFEQEDYLPVNPINDMSTKDQAVNDLSELQSNESVSPLGDAYLDSEVETCSPLSIREITNSSSTDTLDEKVLDEQIEKEPIFRYLIRVPRYFDDRIEENIRHAKAEVDERIRIRDAIRVKVERQKATCNEYRDKFEAAKSAANRAYDYLHERRQEVNSIQSELNSIKNANSVEEIGKQIRTMQHRIEHETISLKEEKQLIREMKQLKLQQQQLCSVQDSEKVAVDQREEIEKHLKHLKQDLDRVRNSLRQDEENANAPRKRYLEEKEKLRDMQEQVRSANDLQQEAYRHLQELKKQRYEKNDYYRKYRDDERKAVEYGSTGNTEALHSHCVNQVEKIMELWNKNDDFRNEYLQCNTWSTWKRLGTSEVLALDRPKRYVPVTAKATDEIKSVSQEKLVLPLDSKNKFFGKQKQNRETSQSKAEQAEERTEKENKQTEENEEKKRQSEEEKEAERQKEEETRKKEEEARTKEEEARKKEEETRKKEEEAAIKRREQLLLEERVKAKEAEERKKRNADKAQARAELKAHKEAEQKEKNKAKKDRRKARKKTVKGDIEEVQVPAVSNSETSAPESAITQEQELEEPKSVISKRPQKSSALAKQPKMTRVVPLPPPLRNKNKKRMQTWMWVLLVTVIMVIFGAVILLPDLRHMLL